MIKKLLLALCLSSTLAFAQSNSLTIYIPFAVGSTTDVTCRTLFDTYAAENNVKVIPLNQTGGDQIVGHQAFIKSSEPALFCAGNGIIFNQVYKKDIAPPLSTLKPVTDVLKLSHFILTPESGPDTLDAVVERSKRTGKPVLVGAPALTSSKVLVYALEKLGAKYEVVVYRKPQEAIISLKDGSLDTYVDGGSIKMIEGVTGIKEIAHASITSDKSKTENLIKRWPEIENITSMTIIYAKSTVPDNEVEQYSRQLRKTINGPVMREYFKTNVPFHNVVPTTPKQSQEKAQRLLNYLNAQQ